MKLRLYAMNTGLPLLALLALGYLPLKSLVLPDYLVLGLILFTLGRAFLLLHQQAFFAMLPFFFFSLPKGILPFTLDVYHPYVPLLVSSYLLVVNLQTGQKPWWSWLHCLNWLLLGCVLYAASHLLPVYDDWHPWVQHPPEWLFIAIAIVPLFFAWWWRRLGRFAAYWPMLMMIPVAYDWAPQSYIFLWMSLACLFSLTLDSYFMAFVDELTGIAGRRALEFKLKTLPKHYYLAMLDVDHFKKFNDTHGHQVGDDVLRTVAKLISQTRQAKAYRYGGEEFALVFKNGAVSEIVACLEETRKAIAEYPLYPKSRKRDKNSRGKGSQRKPLHITVSFGLAQQHKGESHPQVIERADKALYQAKKKGRNRIEKAK
ncbi:GGDEF domain-containing protein [Bermanella marisrubri]|uniref:diguanylate cyclase n=1 Tax=Bermanella marisrubri TaxID=207949 RepID=Q1MZM1_9GAMM|nr:GGDEF domain-containing protein [Bermanella marisrubri]EAT11390.1 sensory transduction protein kinase [Oceanobacter sp. RED65] [Bermanella marisrubri]QIZ85611.1 GGDEF domain-containing protein [Bermanella marisrubri]